MVNVKKINKQIKDVENFMTSFQQPILESPKYNNLAFRISLIEEELKETQDAKSYQEYLDGCVDTLYVVYGSFASLGLRRQLTELDFVCPYIDENPLREMIPYDEDYILSLLNVLKKNPYCQPDDYKEGKYLEEDLDKSFNLSKHSIHKMFCHIIYSIQSRFSGKMEEFLDKAWKVVDDSNMSKLFKENEIGSLDESWEVAKIAENQYSVKNENGKVMKSPSYIKADEGLRKILVGQ
jgi:hypothetical protein